MAVFTPLTRDHIVALLNDYNLGSLLDHEGILQGVDNTNYKIKTSQGQFILTVFEQRINPLDIPYFLSFMAHLSQQDIMCPSPIPRKDTGHISTIADKPACLFSFLDGHNLTAEDITPTICAELGTFLARMHVKGQGFSATRVNSMGLDAWETRIHRIGAQANDIAPDLEYLLSNELNFLKAHWPQNLPTGNIHADLFPDNVFQKDGHLYGVIDFYFSATDYLIYDLAIVLNAWCFDDGRLNSERWNALRAAYENVRPLSIEEKESFQIIARGAAMRFIASRLYDLVFHDAKNLVTPKDPMEYIKILKYHMDNKVF